MALKSEFRIVPFTYLYLQNAMCDANANLGEMCWYQCTRNEETSTLEITDH